MNHIKKTTFQTLLFFFAIFPWCVQAMIYHRIECGDFKILTYQDKIVALHFTEKQIGILTYSIDLTRGFGQFEIENLEVSKEYIRKGIGSRLVKAAETRATIEGCQTIALLASQNAKDFWIKVGFSAKDPECLVFSKQTRPTQIRAKL